ncbi:iron-sulfur cluster biosynthesis transcriptional regulator SufR [Lyngbya confervoides]|uniref:Iron-sulfur cluster biosynthesis transcriptional regulator SufR n=1 Tax=Lyngbya confervoides BDU141951 TaxID=1574623 RepID=A0ABD4T1Q5_9CYAN|nr:iron-sulfur cluster biosynthesis transcriptional regulator SufR [Lyngbya confervoides]MCM1982331.1 iron-sulfur cluster biosynthesis transcriptional regulator SufR [Lyngbya confervoides BDU141951]
MGSPESMASAGHSTKQDILNYLLRQGRATANDLATALAVSPQAIRRHLKDLEGEGLLEFELVQEGMGRPQHTYRLSKAGRDRLPDRHDEFALDLLDTLAETVGPDQMQTILRKQWERKALEYQQKLGKGPLAERVAELVQLRKNEGYMAEYYPQPLDADPSQAKEFILTEYNCAIAHVAESFPKVCDHELEMFALALEDCAVERTHWIVNGEHRCGYLIQLR